MLQEKKMRHNFCLYDFLLGLGICGTHTKNQLNLLLSLNIRQASGVLAKNVKKVDFRAWLRYFGQYLQNRKRYFEK